MHPVVVDVESHHDVVEEHVSENEDSTLCISSASILGTRKAERFALGVVLPKRQQLILRSTGDAELLSTDGDLELGDLSLAGSDVDPVVLIQVCGRVELLQVRLGDVSREVVERRPAVEDGNVGLGGDLAGAGEDVVVDVGDVVEVADAAGVGLEALERHGHFGGDGGDGGVASEGEVAEVRGLGDVGVGLLSECGAVQSKGEVYYKRPKHRSVSAVRSKRYEFGLTRVLDLLLLDGGEEERVVVLQVGFERVLLRVSASEDAGEVGEA